MHADPAAPRSARQVVVSAVLVNVLNPKLTIFFVAFFPHFVGDSPGAVWQMLQLSAVFMLVTLVVFAGYGWGAAAVRTHVLTRPGCSPGCAARSPQPSSRWARSSPRPSAETPTARGR